MNFPRFWYPEHYQKYENIIEIRSLSDENQQEQAMEENVEEKVKGLSTEEEQRSVKSLRKRNKQKIIEANRQRLIEEHRLLSLPYDEATPEELKKAQLIVKRRAEHSAKMNQKYHSLTAEEKRNVNILRGFRAKKKREKRKRDGVGTVDNMEVPCYTGAEQSESNVHPSETYPEVNVGGNLPMEFYEPLHADCHPEHENIILPHYTLLDENRQEQIEEETETMEEWYNELAVTRSPDLTPMEGDLRKQRRLDDRLLLDTPSSEATQEQREKATLLVEQNYRKNEKKRERYRELSDEEKKDGLKACILRYKKRMETAKMKTTGDQVSSYTLYRQKHNDLRRQRCLEERRLLEIPHEKATPEELQKIKLLLEKKAERAAKWNQKYRNLSAEEKEKHNKLRKIRKLKLRMQREQAKLGMKHEVKGPSSGCDQLKKHAYLTGTWAGGNVRKIEN